MYLYLFIYLFTHMYTHYYFAYWQAPCHSYKMKTKPDTDKPL